MSVSACLSAYMSQKLYAQDSRYFLYVLPVIMARFFSDDSAVRFVLMVLWWTSCFSHNEAYDVMFRQVRQVAAPVAKFAVNDCFIDLVRHSFCTSTTFTTCIAVVHDVADQGSPGTRTLSHDQTVTDFHKSDKKVLG